MMKNNEINGRRPGYLFLFPRSFRFVGIGLIVLAFAFVVCGRIVGKEARPLSFPVSRYIADALMVLGLLFGSSAKWKNEDEMSYYLRFQAITYSFFFVVVYFLVSPLFRNYPASWYIFMLLFSYWAMNEIFIRRNR